MGRREKMTLAVLIVLLMTSSLYTGRQLLANFTEAVPAQGGSYSEGIIGQPRFINPLLATSDTDQAIIKLVYSGLYRLDNNGDVVSDLAEDLPKISENGQEYTIKMKQSAQWHDGTVVTADDVVFTIQTLQNPQFNSPRRADWQSSLYYYLPFPQL